MATLEKKNFSQPDESNSMEKMKMETITMNGVTTRRITVEPGWQWSKHLGPTVGGDSCQMNHFLYILSGNLHTKMNSGAEIVAGAGDIVVIPPGHDGWNEGDVPAVWLELSH